MVSGLEGWFISPAVSVALRNGSYLASIIIGCIAFIKFILHKPKHRKP